MNTVGIFAGRGDVILAMGMSLLLGIYIGYQLCRFKTYIKSKFN